MSDVDTLFSNLFLVNEPVIIDTEKRGLTWHLTLDPLLFNKRAEERLEGKISLFKREHPNYGISWQMQGDDNTFGPIGRHGAGMPVF